MILDEIFDSSLDSTGTEEFLKIIRYVIKDANIFVIKKNASTKQVSSLKKRTKTKT
jgi:hypothetical protein